jgi:hypothetical protein
MSSGLNVDNRLKKSVRPTKTSLMPKVRPGGDELTRLHSIDENAKRYLEDAKRSCQWKRSALYLS